MLPDHGVALVAHSGAFPCSTHTRVGAHTHVRGNAKSRHYAPLTPLMGRSPWIAKNPTKRRAHHDIRNALRRGRMNREPCKVCGSTEAEAHHEDYSRPLDVEWLCPKHHAERHRGGP